MIVEKLIVAFRYCSEYTFCNECPIFDDCDGDMDEAMRIAADAIEKYIKIENALKSLIDGRNDPVSCNVDAILKGEEE